MTRVKPRRDPRARHDGCGWDCDCATGRARMWALHPHADLTAAQWDDLTLMLTVRSGGRCEVCGGPFTAGEREANRHHRRARAAGGTDDPCINGLANLLLVCAGRWGRLGGVGGCHGRIGQNPTWGERRGLLVPWGAYVGDGTRPPEVDAPVTLWSGRRVWLDPHDVRYRSEAA